MRRGAPPWVRVAAIAGVAMAAAAAPALLISARDPGAHTHADARGPRGDAGGASDRDVDFSGAMSVAMDRMMAAMRRDPRIGDPDADFLAMMIPHHEAAVEMARLVLLHGGDPLVRQLAERILASQQTEIDAMRARLRLLQGPQRDEFPELSGQRGPSQASGRPR